MTNTIADVIKALKKQEDEYLTIVAEASCGYEFAHEDSMQVAFAEAVEIVTTMTKDMVLRPIPPPRGEPMPQTVEGCQAVMERDAELMLEMKAEISSLKQTINNLRQKSPNRRFIPKFKAIETGDST